MSKSLVARREHWPRVGCLPCIVTGSTHHVTLHHVHGGSIAEIGLHRGTSQKMSDWLVIPLSERYHTGEYGIDSGDVYWGCVDNWEEAFGTQREMLDRVSLIVGYNVYRCAGIDYENVHIKHLPARPPVR